MSTLETKIPNLDTQKRIASALENLAGTVVSDAIKAYVDEQIKAKRLESMPVGYVWVSFSDTNPEAIVGGTWSLIEQGRMLLAAGSSYPVESTGGESAHTLTIDEMPNHNHDNGAGFTWKATNNSNSPIATPWGQKAALYHESYNSTGSTGGGGSHNNMPPYIAVYMFRRTA